MARYFAYGSNMNPHRMRERGMRFSVARAAALTDVRLVFNKASRLHPGIGHANLQYAPGEIVEGVLYDLVDSIEIARMDRFESAPVNYSREVVHTSAGESCWTYFANPAVLRMRLLPSREYLDHLLAGEPYLSAPYLRRLAAWPCAEPPP